AMRNRFKDVDDAKQKLKDAINALNESKEQKMLKAQEPVKSIKPPNFEVKLQTDKMLSALSGLEKGTIEAAKAAIESQEVPLEKLLVEAKAQNDNLVMIDRSINGLELGYETV